MWLRRPRVHTESLDGDFLMFAAGSGITPVFCILARARERQRRVRLLYANRDERR